MLLTKTHRKDIQAKSLLLTATAAMLFSTPVWASSHAAEPWKAFFSLGGGVAISSEAGESQDFPIVNPVTDSFYNYHSDGDSQTQGVFDLVAGAEWTIDQNWGLQLGLDYAQSGNFEATGTLTQGVDIPSSDTYTYHYLIKTRQLMAEAKALYLVADRYRPYLMAGAGVAFNEAYEFGTNASPFLTFTRQYEDHMQTSFTYAVGAGIDVDVLSNLRLGVGYRFVDFGKVELGSASIDTTSVSGTLSQDHMYANEVMAQLTFLI